MPRALDTKQLLANNDPNRSGTEFHIGNFQQIDQLIQQILDGAFDSFKLLVIPAIEELTGLDLTAVMAVLDELELDFSSPVAFLTSLIHAVTLLPDLLIALLTSLVEQLVAPGNSGMMTDLLGGFIELLITLPTLLFDLAQGLLFSGAGIAGIADIFEAITGTGLGDVTDLLGALTYALTNIPFFNIIGIGGPATGADTVQSTWDQLISGFVGAIGTGAGLADLFNISNNVSSRATLGMFSWDILGIRNNKSLLSGLLPTSESNIGLDKVGLAGSAPTFALTQSTAITAFQRISESAPKGVVSWLGSGATSITHFFVNIYRMNPTTGNMTLVHESNNIAGDLSGSMQYNVYDVVPPIAVAPGEVYGIELALRGAGTHSVVGSSSWLPDHPTVFPKRMSALRNSGTSAAPATIASGSVTYTGNVPFMEFGVTSGDLGAPHSPQTVLFNAVGATTVVIPTWCEEVEVIAVGGGGGGDYGSGPGGGAGHWATETWVRGVDFTSDVTIHVTVRAGGAGGALLGAGANGGASTVTLSGHTVTAAGGTGGGSPGQFGQGAGNQVYNEIVYVGGGPQNTDGEDGAVPGGGGDGGVHFVLLGSGGDGARGSVWVRFVDTITAATTPTPPAYPSATLFPGPSVFPSS